MNKEQLLSKFSSLGLKLKLRGDKLEVSPKILISETIRAYIHNNKAVIVAALRNDFSKRIVTCNGCSYFIPDEIGDGSGIGTCREGIEFTQEINRRLPLYRYANRHCTSFNEGNCSDGSLVINNQKQAQGGQYDV